MARTYRRGRSSASWQKWLIDRQLDEALRGQYKVIEAGVAADLVGALIKAVSVGGAAASGEVQALAHALSTGRIPPNRMLATHREIGVKAQRSVLSAYDNRKNRRDLPAYRQSARNPRNIRFAGGRLRAALRAPDFFEATEHGLSFINTQRLSKEAKQWRRLNFGAGVPNSSRQFNVYFADMLVSSLGLDPGTQPGRVKLPPGRFVEPGGGGKRGGAQAPGAPGTGMFYPLGELRGRTVFQKQQNGAYGPRGGPKRMPRLTIDNPMWVKIEATNFLDEGVRRMANEWGPAYTKLFRDHFNETMARAKQGGGLQDRAYARQLRQTPPRYIASSARARPRRR